MKIMKGALPGNRKKAPSTDPRDRIDDEMWELMGRCWSKNPKARPTCREILEELERQGVSQQTDESEDYMIPEAIVGTDSVNLNQVQSILDEVGILPA